MTKKNKSNLMYFSFLLLLLSMVCIVFADPNNEIREDKLIKNDKLTYQDYDSKVAYANVISNINSNITGLKSENLSLMSFIFKPSAKLSPDAILQSPEVLYIIDGEAVITAGNNSIHADKGEVIYIPPNVTRLIENQGDEILRLISCIDIDTKTSPVNQTNPGKNINISEQKDLPQVINETEITPNTFVNTTTGENFTFFRLLHPIEKPLDISYDLGTAMVPAGGSIPEHYVDGHSQIIFFLSGSGNASVACTRHPVQKDDILYIAPGAVMNMSADDDLHFMIITSPYYKAEDDYSFTDACVND